MSSKFSNDLANGMDAILKDSNFQRIFSKTASVKTAAEENFDDSSKTAFKAFMTKSAQTQVYDDSGDSPSEFGMSEVKNHYPDIYDALPDSVKNKSDLRFFTSNGKWLAVDLNGKQYDIDAMINSMVSKTVFKAFASKKKKSEDEEDEKDDKDSDKDEKSDKKKSDKKDSDEDDKDDKKSKKSKKDDDDKDEDDKDDKKKDKKKSFPFFKKKKAGVEGEKCECGKDECDCGDKMYASALKHIVESFTVTSDVLDNMGLEKSAVATMAILNHIIEEAATLKFAKESEEGVLKEKLEKLKAKFKDMHSKGATHYDDHAAEALDEKITKIEDELKELKKKDLKADTNDVRGTDLLLGLEDQEAHEGFMDPELDDPKSSAVLEDILSKNPKLVDDIAPNLKSKFNDSDIEKQLKSRIQSRLPEVVHTPEDTNIDSILKAYQEARNIPPAAKLPGDFEKGPKHDPLKTQIDQLNAKDEMDDDQLVKVMVKKLQHNFKDYDDSGEIDCTKLSEDIADEFDLYEDDDGKIPERVFDAAVEAAEAYESLKENDEESDELNFANDIARAYTLVEEWTKTAHEFEDDHDNEISVGDVESILDVLGNYSQDEIAEKEKSFKHPKNLSELSNEFYDAATKHDLNSSDDEDFGLEKLQKEYPEAYEALPEPYKNDSALVFFIDANGNLCAEGDFGTNNLEEFLWVSDTREWIAIK